MMRFGHVVKSRRADFVCRQFTVIALQGKSELQSKLSCIRNVLRHNHNFANTTNFSEDGTNRSSVVHSCKSASAWISQEVSVYIRNTRRTATCGRHESNSLLSTLNKIRSTFGASRQFSTSSIRNHIMDTTLQDVVKVLETMADPKLAGSWDNVGLLLEPSPPHIVNKLLLTNDLTPAVMQEAVEKKVDVIVSYHPPIFAPLKRVTQSSWKEKIVATCLEKRIALYSPHTSWDAMKGGVNDWLISAFKVQEVRPIEQSEETVCRRNKQVTFWTSTESALTVSKLPLTQPQLNILVNNQPGVGGTGEANSKVCIHCPASSLPSLLSVLQQQHVTYDNLECIDLAKVPVEGCGMGRVGQLESPLSVEEAVSAIKSHLKLEHVRLAQTADRKTISTVAVCAGSGVSVLRGVKADLYLTGEMSHHDVLDAVCRGSHVVLCDHSNTERGFLDVVKGRLSEKLPSVSMMVSSADRDPLTVV